MGTDLRERARVQVGRGQHLPQLRLLLLQLLAQRGELALQQ